MVRKDSYLHTDDRVNEEQHRYEETNVRQSLKEDNESLLFTFTMAIN